MIFRRRQDEMEGFRRMREALRQQADPQDHALLEEQYGAYEDDAALEDDEDVEDEGDEDADEGLEEAGDLEPFDHYAEERAEAAAVDAPSSSAVAAMPPPSRPPLGGPSMTTIGADTSWTGTLRSESNVYLEGKVEGTLEARDTIYIAERATIDARVKARSIVVSGHLTGHIDCEGRLEITPTGRLNGEVEAGSLIVHEGALIDGKFKMKNTGAGPGR
jgi:cytoskeletal protein CcmA (bactofilin family)